VATGKLNINMSSYQVSGDFTHNGNAFPGNVQNTGQIVFRDTATGIDNVLALTADGSYDHLVVKAAYAIVYQHLQGEDVPQNKNAIINAGVIVKSPAIIDVNVVSRVFSVPVFHNGGLFPASAQQHGNILLRDLDSEDLVYFGKTSLQNLSKRIIPGSYDVYYSHLNGDDVPQNTMARIHEDFVVPPPGPMIQLDSDQIYVNSYQLSGQMLLNDAPMPATEYDDGWLRLKREEDTVLLANTHDQSFQVRVVNQAEWVDFQVHYELQDLGAKIPANEDARFMCVRLVPPIF